jgi:outer membrane immunogenic protein
MVLSGMGRLSSAALVLLTSGGLAFAADLPSRRVAPAPYVAVPVFTWTGFYAGVNAGYGFGGGGSNSVNVPAGTFAGAPATAGTITGTQSGSRNGFVGGGQVGYNYQIGNIVVGVETDIQYADLGQGSSNYGYSFAGTGTLPSNFVAVNQRRGVDWFGTVRGRVGYAFDRVLVYGTGGLAYGGGDSQSGTVCSYMSCNDNTRIGYAAGAGVEYAFTPNWTAKLEGLYVNLGKSGNGVYGYDSAGTVYVASNTRQDQDFGVVRLGVNYKF